MMKTPPDYQIRPPFLSKKQVKVVPLSCHCKLRALVPLLQEILKSRERPRQ